MKRLGVAVLVAGLAAPLPFMATRSTLFALPPAAATVGTSSALALQSNTNRRGLIMVNTSANMISCAIGSPAVLNAGISLAAGVAWTMQDSTFTTGPVNCIAAAGSSNLSIQEFN